MKTCQYLYQAESGWTPLTEDKVNPSVLLAFGSGKDCSGDILVDWWKSNFPEAQLIGCSSAGEISHTSIHTNSIVVTAIEFEKTPIKIYSIDLEKNQDSEEVGQLLANGLPHDDLKLCFVLSEGIKINGSRLASGLQTHLPKNTLITGGLAGDGTRFEETLVCMNGNFSSNKVVVMGLYGEHIQAEFGSKGGWDSFGPTRLITESDKNILYTLDGQNALELYKKYLGPHSQNLPSSALRFPLLVSLPDGQKVVRTILAVDEKTGSMIFAGDVPKGSYAELMHANFDRLIDGASDAANEANRKNTQSPDLAILISCVGRRLVLDQRVEEELEAVHESFGDQTALAGFYSYGEICPLDNRNEAILHNQTMTITTFREL